MYDIIIIGGGPAGLTAALYAKRANKSVLVLEKSAFGGQITFSPLVENIPGREPLSGNDFAASLVDQVLELGADLEPAEALEIKSSADEKTVVTDSGKFSAKAVIIACGAKHRTLGVPGEESFIGSGISFCAVCDGAFYQGKSVGVVGGGNSALQEALLLADLCEHVTVIQNLDFLTGENRLCERLASKKNVEVIYGSTVSSINGDDNFEGVTVKNSSGEEKYIPLDGLFVAIGLIPQNAPFASVINTDSFGYAASGEDCLTETPGIFVAGDCRAKKIRQVTTACADGAVAALAACDYIDGLPR